MLKLLETRNVGPARSVRLELAERLNVFTGDNGLGKSFLLDVAWWALTRTWAGRPAMPMPGSGDAASIAFSFDSVSREVSFESEFDRLDQRWTSRPGRPANPGLVLYARVDGGFSVWDPARNYWRNLEGRETPDRPPAFHFSMQDIWNGLEIDGKVVSNGLLRDWVSWQSTKSPEFDRLCDILAGLSPDALDRLRPGQPTRIDLDDARLVPTIAMPYGQEVPVTFLSAGMRRIVAIGYLLVWAWHNHLESARFLSLAPAREIIFLMDEIESHLHPKWQRMILKAIIDVCESIAVGSRAKAQLLASTHSPLVLTSVEPVFDDSRDAWFDIDLAERDGRHIVDVVRRPFVKQGDVSNWLTSDAFGLPSARSREAEQLIEQASRTVAAGADTKSLQDIEMRLASMLPENDPFWRRWQALYDMASEEER